MTDRELLQQALEALEDACGGRCNAENNPCWQRDIANALRGRVEQLKPLRPWVGLEQSDMPEGESPMFDHQYFIAGMAFAAKVLEEKNK